MQFFINAYGNHYELYEPLNSYAIFFQIAYLLIFLKKYKKINTLPGLISDFAGSRPKTAALLKRILTVIEAVAVFAVQMLTCPPVSDFVSHKFLGSGYTNPFAYILTFPLSMFVTAVILGISPLKLMDYIAPSMPLSLIFYKLGCYCCGCCFGIVCDTPFYNHREEHYDIPMQLIEMACAFAIFIIVLIILKRKHKPGSVYASFIILFCVTRFISEFLRGEPEGGFGPFNGFQVLCAIGFANGLLLMIISCIWGGRISAFFEKHNEKAAKFIFQKISDAVAAEYGVPEYVKRTRKNKPLKVIKRIFTPSEKKNLP